jgi:predicted GIY-YIG superfamily endonuclease
MAFGSINVHGMSLVSAARRMAPSLSRVISVVYILQLRSGAFYVGCSDDVETRFEQHCKGTACHTTAIDPPLSVLFLEVHPNFQSARRREAQLKKWSRAKKEALIAGDISRLRMLSRSRR